MGDSLKTAAAYLRVSTEEQTTDNQLPAIRAWCKAHDVKLVEVYSENASAWSAGHQKELSRLLKDLRSGKCRYDYLVVWALDRLTRQGPASILGYVDIFKAHQCQVISIQESWTEQGGMMAELLYSVVGWVAKVDSERKSERVKSALAKLRAKGVKLGRPTGSKDKRKRRRTGYLLRYADRDK